MAIVPREIPITAIKPVNLLGPICFELNINFFAIRDVKFIRILTH